MRYELCGIVWVKPMLKEVDAQHSLQGKRRPFTLGVARQRVRNNQSYQLSSRHHQVHLVENSRLRARLLLCSNPVDVLCTLICFMASMPHAPCQSVSFAERP